MEVETVVPLAQGLWREGARHGDAVLRPLTGADEAHLVELADRAATAAERITALLARTVARIGGIAPVDLAGARALSVGDRERLVLALHRFALGPHLEAVAACPVPGCGALMELDLAVDTLLTGVADAGGPVHEIEVATGGGPLRVRFRLPDGGDQEAQARRAAHDPAGAGDEILRRAILAVTGGDGRPVPADEALAALRAPLAAAFARLDPQIETTLALDCPECGAATEALLDAGTFVLDALARTDDIFAEVDRIARRYHWSEAEILALPAGRRRRYLGLIAGAEAET
jgi:hypothetical protein